MLLFLMSFLLEALLRTLEEQHLGRKGLVKLLFRVKRGSPCLCLSSSKRWVNSVILLLCIHPFYHTFVVVKGRLLWSREGSVLNELISFLLMIRDFPLAPDIMFMFSLKDSLMIWPSSGEKASANS